MDSRYIQAINAEAARDSAKAVKELVPLVAKQGEQIERLTALVEQLVTAQADDKPKGTRKTNA